MNKSMFFALFASTLLTAQEQPHQIFQPEPVEVGIVGIREIHPKDYTGIYKLTDRTTELFQHIGPALLAYAGTDPRNIDPLLVCVTALAFHNCILLPVSKSFMHSLSRVLEQEEMIPLLSNPWHKDRSVFSWLTRAARNIGAHTYNQYVKVCAATAPWIILGRVLPNI